MVLSEIQLAQSEVFCATQLEVASIGSPLLIAPHKIFYDPAHPGKTFLVQPLSPWFEPDCSSLADWITQA